MSYTNRTQEEHLVIEKTREDGYFTLSFDDGYTISCSEKVFNRAVVGKPITREEQRGLTTGWLMDGDWIERKTDSDLEEDHKRLLQAFEDSKMKAYLDNKPRWEEMEASLPHWLRDRVEFFFADRPEKDRVEGWGYEVTVAKLAEYYLDRGSTIFSYSFANLPPELTPDSVNEFAKKEGTTGFMHSAAYALAKDYISANGVS